LQRNTFSEAERLLFRLQTAADGRVVQAEDGRQLSQRVAVAVGKHKRVVAPSAKELFERVAKGSRCRRGTSLEAAPDPGPRSLADRPLDQDSCMFTSVLVTAAGETSQMMAGQDRSPTSKRFSRRPEWLTESLSILTDKSLGLVDRELEAASLAEAINRGHIARSEFPELGEALVQVTSDPDDHERVQHEAAHALVYIWFEEGIFRRELYERLAPAAKDVVTMLVQEERPEWLSEAGR
jgi:hypothetical protein